VIIELQLGKKPKSRSDVLEEIWPYVLCANSEVQAHARIPKGLVIILDQQKVIPRIEDGGIARSDVEWMFAGEIEKAYGSLDEK